MPKVLPSLSVEPICISSTPMALTVKIQASRMISHPIKVPPLSTGIIEDQAQSKQLISTSPLRSKNTWRKISRQDHQPSKHKFSFNRDKLWAQSNLQLILKMLAAKLLVKRLPSSSMIWFTSATVPLSTKTREVPISTSVIPPRSKVPKHQPKNRTLNPPLCKRTNLRTSNKKMNFSWVLQRM